MNEGDRVVQISLDDIIPNRFQPREVFDEKALKELAQSIKENGVLQPIIVREVGDKYEIIAGERRYKATTLAGLTEIPAIVKDFDDKKSSKMALIENIQRQDLTPIEEARTYQTILNVDEMTQKELADSVGKSQSAVSNKLRLLTLPEEVQQALLKGEISERHARSLLNVTDREKQVELLHQIIEKKLPVRVLDKVISDLNEEKEDVEIKEEVKEEQPNSSQKSVSHEENNSAKGIESLLKEEEKLDIDSDQRFSKAVENKDVSVTADGNEIIGKGILPNLVKEEPNIPQIKEEKGEEKEEQSTFSQEPASQEETITPKINPPASGVLPEINSLPLAVINRENRTQSMIKQPSNDTSLYQESPLNYKDPINAPVPNIAPLIKKEVGVMGEISGQAGGDVKNEQPSEAIKALIKSNELKYTLIAINNITRNLKQKGLIVEETHKTHRDSLELVLLIKPNR